MTKDEEKLEIKQKFEEEIEGIYQNRPIDHNKISKAIEDFERQVEALYEEDE